MVTALRQTTKRLVPRASHPAAERLLKAIQDEFESLSRQLKLIARHVEKHRDHIGLDRIQDVAERCGVHRGMPVAEAAELLALAL